MTSFIPFLRTAARLAAACLALAAATGALALDLQAHRGGRGLAPENTLAAFSRALEIGVTTLELDIALTADGVPVVMHDPLLNPAIARDASGRWIGAAGPAVHTLTLAQLQAYDVGRLDPATAYGRGFAAQAPQDGERVPTLASLFEVVKARGANDVRFNIEIKTNPDKPAETAPPQAFVDAILRAVRAAGVEDRVTIQSFDWRGLALVRQAGAQVGLAYLTNQTARTDNTRDPAWTGGLAARDFASPAHMIRAAGGTLWSPNWAAIDAQKVREAQALGLKVIPWTVNEPADMQRLIDWGVDGLITDYPDRLREVMRTRGLPLPRAY